MIKNGDPEIQWKKINGGNPKPYFESIIVSGDFGIGKPDSDLFKIALYKVDSSVITLF